MDEYSIWLTPHNVVEAIGSVRSELQLSNDSCMREDVLDADFCSQACCDPK